MIERNIFISDCEAKENFPKEVDLATVQVDQFSQLLIEQDFEMWFDTTTVSPKSNFSNNRYRA